MSILKNKTAVITGSSRGIGKAIAIKFALNGASIVLVADQDKAGLEETAREINETGSRAEIILGDIADALTSKRAVQCAVEQFKGLDIVVNCAGIITRTPVEELSFEEWSRVLDVNLNGTFHMCRAALPLMRSKSSGKIINVSSQMARLPHPSASPSYEVSKAGQIALTRHLAYHYAKFNICVNSIAPGSINTRMPQSMSADARERLLKAIPFQRLGEPSEVADCALFLASPMSNYITGATIDINGGSLMS